MKRVRLLHADVLARLLAAAALAVGGSAFGAINAHYLGHAADRSEFRLYLDGGEYLGQSGGFQAIRVTVHQFRKQGARRTLTGCVYRFVDSDRSRDRIECADDAPGALRGVVYARSPRGAPRSPGDDGADTLVCQRRCGPSVPRRLRLEDADDDNG